MLVIPLSLLLHLSDANPSTLPPVATFSICRIRCGNRSTRHRRAIQILRRWRGCTVG